MNLVSDIMMHCDDDFELLQMWFSGRGLDMSTPIQVSLATVAMDASGNPIDPSQVGAKWSGFGPWPLQVKISIGELAMAVGTQPMLARYLLVRVVSQMFMRALGPYPGNNWFSATEEGSQGHSLSAFLGQQFLLHAFPGVAALPAMRAISSGVTAIWLNSPRANFIDSNPDDPNEDTTTGCQTLFLFYLHDQLGKSIQDIINKGASTLSRVYENLSTPHDSWPNAWPKFIALVNSHYPPAVTMMDGMNSAMALEMYFPPLETVFPLCELDSLVTPVQATWLGSEPATVGLDRQPQVPVPITFVSSDPTIIASLPVLPAAPGPTPSPFSIGPASSILTLPLSILPQGPSFTTIAVTLTASYAGKSLTRTIIVVRPDARGLPPLDIEVDQSTDRCRPLFVEQTAQTFEVTNLNVFADQNGLVFSWSVTGAIPDATDTPTLTISTLPAAGATVTINVTVKNPVNLQAAGVLTFQTAAAASDLARMAAELRCRITQIVNGALFLPPWVPIEQGGKLVEEGGRLVEQGAARVEDTGMLKKQLTTLEKQLGQVTSEAARVNAVIGRMREFESRAAERR